MARDMAEVRGRAMVRPFRLAQLIDTSDPQAVRAAFVSLTRTWGGIYMPVLEATLSTVQLEHLGRALDVDAMYSENAEGDLAEWLRSTGWGWSGRGQWGPFAQHRGFGRGLLPANSVGLMRDRLFVPEWDRDDDLDLFYTAVFGDIQGLGPGDDPDHQMAGILPNSEPIKLPLLTTRPATTWESIGAVQGTAVGISVADRRYLDGLTGIVVARAGHPEDLVRFWNLRSYGRPILCLPNDGPKDLLDFLTRGSIQGVTLMLGGGPEPRKEECLMVWGLEHSTGPTRAAIDSMAERLCLTPREGLDRMEGVGHPGLETRFESSFRTEFRPTAPIAMVRVPTVPLDPSAKLMPGVVAVQMTINNAHGLDPRSTAQYPPYRRHGKVLQRLIGTVDVDHVRINAEGDGVVVGHQASRDEAPLGFPPHLDGIHALFDDISLKVAQSDDGKFQTRAAEVLGGPFASLAIQPGVRAVIDKAAGTPAGLTLAQLQASVRSNRGVWPDALFSNQTPQEYCTSVTNELLFSGLFVPMLDVHCSNCRVESQVSPRDLDATIRCEFCGEDFKLALSLSLSRNKSKWRYRLASHLSPEKVKALLPALATMSLLGQLSSTNGHPSLHAFGVTFTPAGRDPIEADIVAYLDRPSWVTVLGEVKNSNWIDANDIRNLEELQRRLDDKHVRSLLLFTTLKDEFGQTEVRALRDYVERCTETTTAHNTAVPRFPLLLTAKDLSLPWAHDDHPWRWGDNKGHIEGIFGTAVESCRRNLGLDSFRFPTEGEKGTAEIHWDDRPTTARRLRKSR
ncbi:hypothetical protein V6K52_03355 [Knoellia sp. S7-12]|uniref:hypothetical protein n=1 Tax=Knoellia sp. S7-12 TaxID=3126698 RepID=UPI003367BDE8